MRHALAALGVAAAAGLGSATLSAPSVAGPFLAWSQYEVSGDRFACRDRAAQVMRSIRPWQVTPGQQHVYGEDDQFTAWVRCWTLPGGQTSVATIVVTAQQVSDAARTLRDQIRDALRQPSEPGAPEAPPDRKQ